MEAPGNYGGDQDPDAALEGRQLADELRRVDGHVWTTMPRVGVGVSRARRHVASGRQVRAHWTKADVVSPPNGGLEMGLVADPRAFQL